MRVTRGVAASALGVGLWLAAGCGSSSKGSSAPPPVTSQGTLSMEIQSVTLPDGDGARPVVRFRVTDNATGQPINLANEIAAANASPPGIPNTVPRFTLSQRDDRNDYRSYYGGTANPKGYTVPAGEVAPPAAPALQAQYEPPARDASGKAAPWPVGDLKDVGGGFYELTLPPVNQTGFDRTKTHTVGAWTVRSKGTADADVAATSFDFVPNGGTATRFETITDAQCNACHGFVQAHGTRRGVQLCITCHNPSTTDPDTSRTVDFKVLIHKIHSGATLPSVQQGQGYFIVGFNQTVADFSDVVFPYHNHGVLHCTVCHSGKDADAWRSVPSQRTCTSCHDNVQFTEQAGLDPCPVGTAAAASFKDCLHTGGPLTITDARDPTTCMGCHGPGTAEAIDKFHHGG